MKLIRYDNHSHISKEFIKQLQTNAKEKIVSFITKNKDIFIIKESLKDFKTNYLDSDGLFKEEIAKIYKNIRG